jgi:hypothetical protein
MKQPIAVALEYFQRMQAGKPVADLFTENGELRGLGARVIGRAAIDEFYSRSQRDASPRPEVLTIVADGTRVLAEVHIHLASGERMHVVDGFEVDDDHISSLTYFIADYPPPATIDE